MSGRTKQKTEERTCVECGCTDSRACRGGCFWIVKHPATPTGICNNCRPPGLTIGRVHVARIEKRKLWITHKAGEAMAVSETKLGKALDQFFWKEF